MRETRLEEAIGNTNTVITGESRLDAQTAIGKAPVGVAQLAKKYGKPVVAFSGIIRVEATLCNENGIDAYFPILRNICTQKEAINFEIARKNLADTVQQVVRLIKKSS